MTYRARKSSPQQRGEAGRGAAAERRRLRPGRPGLLSALALALALAGPAGLEAQVVTPGGGAGATDRLGLFLDCEAYCDFDFFRQEIGFVDWVRDRTDADVHVLITSQQTGGGGEAYSLDFLGRRAFDGDDMSLAYTSDVTDTDDETRRGVARTLRVGLGSYAVRTALAPRLDIVYDSPDEDTSLETPLDRAQDPWNLWVFEVGLEGAVQGESQTKEWDAAVEVSASRTTPFWKHGFSIEVGYSHDTFTLEDDDEIRTLNDVRRSFETVGTSVRSVGGRWSAGLRSGASSSTRQNLDFEFFTGPAIEYSFFPYEEFTRRQLIFLYTVSGNYLNYLEETIFEQTNELVYRHSAALAFAATQPWGEARVSVGGAQYLHDASKYSLELETGIELRIVRGLSLDVSGDVEWIRDQLSLPKEGASPEDVLLERRELATNYRYAVQLGLSYRFGSPFNNIVNPRLDDLDWRF